MPHVIIKHFPATLDRRARAKLKDAIEDAIQDAFGVETAAVSIALQEVPADRWHEAVYAPDIEPQLADLLKAPGYQSRASNG